MTTRVEAAHAPWASDIVQRRMRELSDAHGETSANEVVAAVQLAQRIHENRTSAHGINLYAGSNVLSPAVEAAHNSSLANRPSLGWPGEKVQPDMREIEALEVIATQQLARAFRAHFAEPRYLTATLANLGAYAAFTEPGDTIATLSPESGSHASHLQTGTAGVRGLHTVPLPYSGETLDVDHALLNAFVDSVRPKIILVGGSVILFPHELAPLREAADRVGALLMYDASHVAGLIAAGVFQNPLDEGADLVTFSTYKTLAGPAGGASITNNREIAERMSHSIYPVLSSNYDASRLGPLAIAVAEASEQAPAWASATIDLARTLGEALASRGLGVAGASRGITATHQVVIDVSDFGGGASVLRRLERRGLAVGACRLPGQSATDGPMGIRIGTQEIVRRGATLGHAADLADLIQGAIQDAPSVNRLVVDDLRSSFGRDIWGRPAA